MRSRATKLLDEMIANGSPAEFVQQFAFPLPAEIVFRLIGFPPEDDRMISHGASTAKRSRGVTRPTPSRLRLRKACSTTGATAGSSLPLVANSVRTISPQNFSTPGRPIRAPTVTRCHDRHFLQRSRVGGLRHQFCRPRPGDRPDVQHVAVFTATS